MFKNKHLKKNNILKRIIPSGMGRIALSYIF